MTTKKKRYKNGEKENEGKINEKTIKKKKRKQKTTKNFKINFYFVLGKEFEENILNYKSYSRITKSKLF